MKHLSKFKSGHFTIAGLQSMGFDILSVELQNKWAVCITNFGRIKIRMHEVA